MGLCQAPMCQNPENIPVLNVKGEGSRQSAFPWPVPVASKPAEHPWQGLRCPAAEHMFTQVLRAAPRGDLSECAQSRAAQPGVMQLSDTHPLDGVNRQAGTGVASPCPSAPGAKPLPLLASP